MKTKIVKKKHKIIKSRLFAIIFAIFFVVSLFMGLNTYADNIPFKLTDASIIEKSENVSGTITNFDNDKIENNIIFHKVNDYATYKLTIKNNKSNEITIISITDDNNNEYISYEYDKHENEKISSNNTFNIIVKSIYKKELTDTSKRNQSTNVKFIIKYLENGKEKKSNIIINPKTGDNINISIILLIISSIGLITCLIIDKKYKKNKITTLIIMISLITPIIVNAETFTYDLSLETNYGLYNKLLVTINNNGTTETKEVDYNTILNIEDGEKEGYNFKGWKLDDNTYFDKTTPITEDITLTADYEIQKFEVSFNTNGGSSINKQIINYDEKVTKPTDPTKKDYEFINWYADEELQTEFDFNTKIKSNTTIYAKWNEDIFPIVFEHQEECTFNGSNGFVTGEDCSYANNENKYINTGIKLYNTENHDKDYEIGFTIVEYNQNIQVNQATFMNTKLEGNNYPGIVFRRKDSTGQLDLSSRKTKTANASITLESATTKQVKIYRIYNEDTEEQEIFYSINDGEKIKVNDLSIFNPIFDTEVWFGATPKSQTDNTPQRVIKATFKNMYIKVGKYKESTKYKVKLNPSGGEVNPTYINVNKGNTIGTLPTPTKEDYEFIGWYTEKYTGTKVDSSYKPTEDTVLYARWKGTTFNEVFKHTGECTFNGLDGVITGDECTYANGTNKFIDTGIKLYSAENHDKDYEIGFTIVDYNSSIQVFQATFMNTKLEGNNYPGVVFRRRDELDKLDLSSKKNQAENAQKFFDYQSVQKVKIYRIYNEDTEVQEIFYSINDQPKKKLNDLSELNPTFDTTVWFGATTTSDTDLTPQRGLKATLKDMYIKIGKYQDD